MKRFLTLIITVILFSGAVVIGLKNQQLVNVNYLVAQTQLPLSTLFAIVFSLGFAVSTLFALYFQFKLKLKNRSLRQENKKQRKALNKLRAHTEQDQP